ncbi:site-2 protease family protein [Micromonospora sp. CPCC 206060]|uniref:M50 family metallopeptidase n=1 Tax=Micromonospora sp. CPCC 206060 TaxID=3122406 RepID=UPI002FF0A412
MFGVPLYLNASMLLLALLVTVTYGEFVRRQLALSPTAGYVIGFGFVVCLLGSVLLHELGHALTARRYGIGVRGITLELLGGYTEMERDAPTPRIDLLVSLAGPAVSFVLGLAATAATLALPDRTLANQLAFQLAVSNVIVAVFNSLPGLPLDGGRALRAGVWAATRDRHLGTEVAGWVGRVVAVGSAVVVALLTVLKVLAPLALPLMLLVSFTLWRGAGQSIRLARISRRFPLVDLARLARRVLLVPSGTPLAEAQRQRDGSGGPTALGIADAAGRPVALVDLVAEAAVPVERRPWLAVDAVARSLTDLPRLPVGLDGERVVEAVQAHPGAQYLVTAGEDVVGVLHIADLAQLLEPKRKMNT